MTANYAVAQLMKNGILIYKKIEDTPVGFIKDLNEMTDFVAGRVRQKKDLLFWKIPRMYWKRE